MQSPERRAAMSGYLVIVLGVAATAFERGAPSANAPIAESIAFYSKYRSELLAQSILFVLSAGAYLWFFGSLRAWFDRAEGGAGRASSVAFGAGAVSVTLRVRPALALVPVERSHITPVSRFCKPFHGRPVE